MPILCVLLHLSQGPTSVAKWTEGQQNSSSRDTKNTAKLVALTLVILMFQHSFFLSLECQKVEKEPKYSNKALRIHYFKRQNEICH